MENSDRQWHLDKRVNVSIILALIAQAAVGLTWANRVSFDIDQIKKDQASIKAQMERQKNRFDILIEVKTNLENLREDVKELKDQLKGKR